MDKSATYCVMPHIGMALQNHSDFCTCNINKASWQNNKREVVYVHSHKIDSVYQSHTRKIIATSLDNGIQHSSCQVCWDLEKTKKESPRQNFNRLFAGIESMPNQPRVLIIKPGNTCNFSCRMCNPITSSSWYADGYELERADLVSSSWYNQDHNTSVSAITFNEYTRNFEHIRNSYNSDNVEFWNTLKSWIPNLVYIDIYGGEPFLIPAMFDLLEYGVVIGASKNIKLNLHTNCSVYNLEYLKILSEYKKVGLRISVDSADPLQLEYIRHRASFVKVSENIQKFKSFFQNHSNVELGISYTITPLNVFYTDRDTDQLETMFALPIANNLVTTPEYDIRHLPTEVKSYLIRNSKNSTIIEFLQQIIAGCDVEWPKFCRVTDKLDQLRNQSFQNVFPDWWKILQPYWIKS